MKTFLYPLVFLLLFVASSCKKEAKLTTINGQVRTFGTEHAVTHSPVRVQIVEQRPPASFMSGYSYPVVTEAYCSREGNYSLTCELYEDREYYIAVDHETVKSDQGYVKPAFGNINRPERRINRVGGTINQNYYLMAIGWMKFHLISENPQPGDVYWYSVGGGVYEEFEGSVNAFRTWDFSGNRNHNIYYGLYRDGKYYNYSESVFVPAYLASTHQIKFD
jgi:hypothetical protein